MLSFHLILIVINQLKTPTDGLAPAMWKGKSGVETFIPLHVKELPNSMKLMGKYKLWCYSKTNT
jgi:hypothetical protein